MVTVMDRVSSLLNLAPSLAPTALTYIATEGNYGQGFVEPVAAPEPSTIISAGLGLIGLLVIRLRRRPAGV